MLHFEILRTKKSYDYKADPGKPDGFDNNWKNNSLDDLVIKDDKAEICRLHCQTVANYCFGSIAPGDTRPDGDSVHPGEFTIQAFVEKRKFHGDIHAIVNTKDLDGQVINRYAMQTAENGFQNGRWLIHDRFSFKINQDTNFAWSAGCFILSSADLSTLAEILRSYKVIPGDLIPGELFEV